MSNVGLDKVDSVCIWMNWTQGHHVSKYASSVRTHLAVESNFSYVCVFKLDLEFSRQSWKTTILHLPKKSDASYEMLLQIIQIC